MGNLLDRLRHNSRRLPGDETGHGVQLLPVRHDTELRQADRARMFGKLLQVGKRHIGELLFLAPGANNAADRVVRHALSLPGAEGHRLPQLHPELLSKFRA